MKGCPTNAWTGLTTRFTNAWKEAALTASRNGAARGWL
jgi:hypothetical protein